MPRNRNHEAAWAAGFFDGEGHVGAHSGNRKDRNAPFRTISVQVGQVDREVLDRFRRAIGHGRVFGPYDVKTRKGQPYFQFSASGLRTVTDIFLTLEPFLGSIKVTQFRDAFDRYATAKQSLRRT